MPRWTQGRPRVPPCPPRHRSRGGRSASSPTPGSSSLRALSTPPPGSPAYVWNAGHTTLAPSFGFTATNGNSMKRFGGRFPVHTAPVILPAESVTTSRFHPGTSRKEEMRTSAGKRISTRVVATSFSFGHAHDVALVRAVCGGAGPDGDVRVRHEGCEQQECDGERRDGEHAVRCAAAARARGEGGDVARGGGGAVRVAAAGCRRAVRRRG